MTPIPRNQASFTLAHVAEHTGGRVIGDASRVVRGVCTDSRDVDADSIFVALRGERHDAHAFLAGVSESKAASLVERGRGNPGYDHVEVDDTLVALGDLARAHRRRWTGTVVAITGSAGKTSTKELCAAAIRGAGKQVRATIGNLNNRIGVPMTLFTLEPTDEIAVVEMGTSEPGEIAELARIGEPDIAVVTCVAVAHTEGLGSVDAVGREKRALLTDAATGIVNADDPQLRDHGTVRFGTEGDVAIRTWSFEADRTVAVYEVGGVRVTAHLRLVGEAAVRNAAAALAVTHVLGLDPQEAAKGMESVEPVVGRMRPIVVGDALVLDDTYNANPLSMKIALETAAKLAEQRGLPLQAVLGDMGELGSESARAHREVRALAESLCSEVVFVGEAMTATGPAVQDADDVRIELRGVLLVKGSRFMRLERVVDRIAGAAAIYYYLYPYADEFGALNVLRYVPFRVLAATMTAMLLTFGLYPWFIRRLQTKQIGQVVRDDGPESHFSKAGTPTMGGALMLLAIVLSTVLWADPKNAMVWMVTAITASFGVVGYIDDAAKVRKKNTKGLSGRYKLLIQFAISIAVCSFLFYGESGLPADWLEIRHRMALPFVKFLSADTLAAMGDQPVYLPPWFWVGFASFVIVGTSNAVNLTDGLDGLAIGPVMVNAGTYAILAYLSGVILFDQPVAEYLFIPHLESAEELSIYCASVIGVGFGFLWFNTYPAQVFMGDVGSLALGGGLGALAVATKNELLSVLLGGIFVLEAVSVIIQVGYFKSTGKRIFLMAPIHHHFEKKGWPEPKVIVRFWIISIMLAVAALATLKLR